MKTIRRDEEIFEAFYRQYQSPMLWWALYYLKNKSDAEDAVQEAFLRFWKRMDLVKALDDFRKKALCQIVIRNICLNMQRDKARRREELTDFDQDDERWKRLKSEDEPLSGEPFEGNEPLYRAVAGLDPPIREMLWLSYEWGMSAREIGSLMDMKAGTVNRSLSRARDKLRKILKEDGDE